MHTSFSEEDLAFRDDVRAFFAQAWTDDAELRSRVGTLSTMKEGMIEWQKRLNEKGWVAPHWPVEHGGTDALQGIASVHRVAPAVRDPEGGVDLLGEDRRLLEEATHLGRRQGRDLADLRRGGRHQRAGEGGVVDDPAPVAAGEAGVSWVSFDFTSGAVSGCARRRW